MATFEVSLLYNEYQAMERFGQNEIEFYLMSREQRARHVAYCMISNFASLVHAWEQSKKAK